MYDDVTVANYPADAELVAGYLNGQWPTASPALAARCPGAQIVTIDVNGTRPDADVLDMEWGDATPEMCPPWAIKHLALPNARMPVIYCSLSRVQEVLDAMARYGVVAFRLWVAHYNVALGAHICSPSVCGLPSGAASLIVATQYASPSNGATGEYDESLCSAGWPD